jgi:GNAT superfamily N-acetyltransferase
MCINENKNLTVVSFKRRDISMITIKRLSECALEQGVQAWNDGFQGYFFDATMTVDAFTARLGREGIAPSLSLVAFVGERPIGLVLSGTRHINGKKISWNGGTSVAEDFRHQGVGRLLIQTALEVYQQEGVDIATLEAFSQNAKAIVLYEKMGYKIVDDLVFYVHEGSFEHRPFMLKEQTNYQVKKGVPQDVQSLSWYQSLTPWQTQWEGIRDGESVIAYDGDYIPIGYALYKRTFDSAGKQIGSILFQCAVDEKIVDRAGVISFLLNKVYEPWQENIKCSTFNLPQKNEEVISQLQAAGFNLTATQVYMHKYF